MVDELSIIIPTLNEERYLPKLLDSLVAQNFKRKLQVIIVDGNSIDRTIEVAQKYKKKIDLLILKTRTDIGHQKNVGVENAKYENLLFVDADIILPKNLLSRFTKNVKPNEKSVQNIFFLPDKGPFIHYLVFWLAHLSVAVCSVFQPVTSGGFMFTTKKNHLEIGGFKEGTVAAEDVDYGDRSIKNGAKFKFHYDCFVYNSTRRARLMGIFPMMRFYLRGYLYYKMHGVLYDKEKFNYPYGQYHLIEDNKSVKPNYSLELSGEPVKGARQEQNFHI